MSDDQADIEEKVIKMIITQNAGKPKNNLEYCAYCHSPTTKPIGERCDGCGSKQRITKQSTLTLLQRYGGPR
jgi:uncharacterized paraquat-inducible protein A